MMKYNPLETKHVKVLCPITKCYETAITCTPKPAMQHIYGNKPLYTTCDKSVSCTNNDCPYKVKD